MQDRIVATNRQARHDYDIIESFEAGLELKGSEVKSLRARKASISDSFARVDSNELFLFNCHISPYEYTSSFSLDPKRRRKLLVHKRQIARLIGQTTQKGLTLIPLKIYFKHGIAKIELALCKGRFKYDKRQKIKRKEELRQLRKIKGMRTSA